MLGQDFPVLAIVVKILASRFEDDVHQVVFLCCAFWNNDVALLVEHPRDCAGFGHVPAVLAETVANFANGSVAIVGVDIEQNRNATRSIAFERELFVGCTRQFSRATLNGPLDVVGGHILRFGSDNGAAQAGIRVRITAPVFCGNANFLDESGKNLAALSVKRALLVPSRWRSAPIPLCTRSAQM